MTHSRVQSLTLGDHLPEVPSWNRDPSVHPVREYLSHPEVDWANLAEHYEQQSSEWRNWALDQKNYAKGMEKALDLVEVRPDDVCLEIAAGSVPVSEFFRLPFNPTVSDRSISMLLAQESTRMRIACDVQQLPFQDATFKMVYGLNPVVKPTEALRVLQSDGVLVLVFSFGEFTPVYRNASEVVDELPKEWGALVERGLWGEYQLYFDRYAAKDSLRRYFCC